MSTAPTTTSASPANMKPLHGTNSRGAWLIVARRPWDDRDLWTLIVAAAVVMPCVTVAWIAHNVAIFRRLGPRRAVPPVNVEYANDFYGRRIDADWASLLGCSHVTIDVDAGLKRYRATPMQPPAPIGIGAARRAAAAAIGQARAMAGGLPTVPGQLSAH